ncbi:AcrB/AcrD/AcrF family protein [Sphingomonas sp. KR1UV-12]|uniref:AcrB/AcrD/AcrF family protein n=1 Tax=Sphingomonas aurea TaxID=3063994 RepID=A0ABT9EM05_9SPHN|nr:AcrB/AcrD/AcrF family protein [Sphingomonas sp. KR1UV-12]MDP1027984.1 AcrB/AcrD/AcrF family protein [Sphingomonas sp. KR1UV-12]
MPAELRRNLDRHWLALVLVAWLAIAAWFVWDRWTGIRWLSLGDTDDNMRLMQVRAWMAGQGWYDLRQYRMNPPAGFDIHWSRVVDLPIAGLILLFRQFTSASMAERLACGIAPLLPLGIALVALAATVRRLVGAISWPLALLFLMMSAAQTLAMFMPMRIDHHGWQLACLAVTVAGLCDPRGPRGGALVGLASVVSLAIGLEMLPYIAMAGAITTLRWVWDAGEERRLDAYAVTLGLGGAAMFAAFASSANWTMRCDAFTPVWLAVVAASGLALYILAFLSPRALIVRLALAAAAGAAIVVGFAAFFPQCLGRPEQVSPELARTWLNNVREAKPLYAHPFRVAFPIATLPVIGLVGAIVGAWRARRAPAAVGWAAVALFTIFATLMLLWQTRAGPAAQLLAVPGAVALAVILFPWLLGHRLMPVRVLGTVTAFVLVSGAFAGLAVQYLHIDPPSAYTRRVNGATGECMRTSRLLTLNRYPAATVFTFVDLGPRLITVTHHDAIAGPYHRNGDAILDVQHAFSRSPDQARAIMKRHGATLLLLCPNMAESTIYRSRNPGGFYDRMAHGAKYPWLTPLPLPRKSPYRLYRIS